MRQSKARSIALGGMLTAVAVVVMCLGSMIPVNTYICPVVCMLLSRPVLKICGKKIAFCYYLAVAVLSMMLAPDREAALIYVFLGYYPLIQHLFNRIRPVQLRIIAKVGFFTASGAAAYALLMTIMGVGEMVTEMGTAEIVMLAVAVLLWDVMLLMVDRLLELGVRFRKRK